MTYWAHEESEVRVIDEILFIRAEGSFNLEALQRYRQAIEAAIRSIKRRPFYQVVRLGDSPFLTLEAQAELGRLVKRPDRDGASGTAFVVDSRKVLSLMKDQMSQVLGAAGLKFQFFETPAEAEAWVRHLMAKDGGGLGFGFQKSFDDGSRPRV